jgi:hypothetical protein
MTIPPGSGAITFCQLMRIEEAFRNLKGDLAIRPIFHQLETRVEAHIFIAFLAYCLQATLARRLAALAPGLTPRSVLEKFAALQADRHRDSDHRRARDPAHPPHRAASRTQAPPQQAQARITGPAAPRIASLQAASAPPTWCRPLGSHPNDSNCLALPYPPSG